MRNWINLFEVRRQDGCWLNPSMADLSLLIAKGDLRGVAVGSNIWIDLAMTDTHFGMRNRLGLPPYSYEGGGEVDDGFNFYVCSSGDFHDFDIDDDDHVADDFKQNNNGRQDWVMGNPGWEFGGLAVMSDCDRLVAMQNRGFARMVGHPIMETDLHEKATVIDTEDCPQLTVHVNPTKSDLLSFINNQHDQLVRGIVADKSYFWAAFASYHYDVAEYFGLNLNANGVPLVISTNIEHLKENDDWEYNPP